MNKNATALFVVLHFKYKREHRPKRKVRVYSRNTRHLVPSQFVPLYLHFIDEVEAFT